MHKQWSSFRETQQCVSPHWGFVVEVVPTERSVQFMYLVLQGDRGPRRLAHPFGHDVPLWSQAFGFRACRGGQRNIIDAGHTHTHTGVHQRIKSPAPWWLHKVLVSLVHLQNIMNRHEYPLLIVCLVLWLHIWKRTSINLLTTDIRITHLSLPPSELINVCSSGGNLLPLIS